MEDIRIGRFQVVGPLGSGAHSSILRIRRSMDATHYALKVVPIAGKEEMNFLEQARHEFRVAQMFDHPNLIKIYALETVRDWLFRIRKAHMLIELVTGKTLDNLPRLPIPKLVQVFVKIAAGLTHMHRRNVCHADLKPNNIMLGNNADVKILDFGLAWIKGEEKDRLQGTPEYMAPEQAKRGMVNERTDIYNFGATMYRLVTFRHPPNPMAAEQGGLPLDAKTWRKVLRPVQELNAECPAALCNLIHKCLEFNSMQRPERMSEIQGILDHMADDLVRKPEDKLEATE